MYLPENARIPAVKAVNGGYFALHMFDVVVVGIGTMGSAACEALARRGASVLGLDQFDIPNAQGAHSGASRMFRMAYYEHPDYVPLLRRSLELWLDLERRSGTRLLYQTGALYMSPPNGDLVSRSAQAAERFELEHELLGAGELKKRFPQIVLPREHRGLLERAGGFIVPELAVGVMARQAGVAGAEIHGREGVTEWSADGEGVTVRTARGEYRGKTLILCGGPWSAKLCRGLGVAVTVTRQTMWWVQPKRAELFSMSRLPCWAIERQPGALFYGFPMTPWRPGFKLALHAPGTPDDPDRPDRTIRPEDEAPVRECLRRFFPEADGPVLAAAVCHYDNSPDGHFIIDRHPQHQNVIVATGFSGHGFKFAPAIGQALAEMTLDGATTLPFEFLRLARFAGS